MRAFWQKCIGFRYKDHCEEIIVHRGGGENASKCFLHDLDHWAAHKVFNLSPLCKAELIFRAVGLNSICAKLQGEIYAWNPPYSLFSLFLRSLIPPPCMTLLYRHWFTSETLTWCTISSGLNRHSWTDLRKDAAWMFPPYLNVNSWEIFLSPPGDPPPPQPSPTPALLLCNSISLPVFLCLPQDANADVLTESNCQTCLSLTDLVKGWGKGEREVFPSPDKNSQKQNYSI